MQIDEKSLTLVEVLAVLWQERRTIQDMANDPHVSDADLRAFCQMIALPPSSEDVQWAVKVMEDARCQNG